MRDRSPNKETYEKLEKSAVEAARATGLAFPFVYNTETPKTENQWLDYSCSGGILLDRLRLVFFEPAKIEQSFKLELLNWCRNQISQALLHFTM
jgi:hypothetical protein